MKEPIRLAIALKYAEAQGDAPVITASGRGPIAENIIRAAQKEKVPIYQDQSLAQVLVSLELKTELPPELYQAVAQAIQFVSHIDRIYAQQSGKA